MNNISNISKENIIEGVLAEFAKLAEIPRPSGHEKAVSDYLYKLFSDMGCQVEQDKVNNIIADMAATDDCQDKPLVVLQAHMDMVCVADDGVAYDPLNDPIKLVREGDKLHADGTSLGADDGMGIAIMVYIMKNLQSHGPIRAIITVDEEAGMTGSMNLTDNHFEGVKYLINCDSEDWDLLTVGSGGRAKNVIPSVAEAVFYMDMEPAQLQQLVDEAYTHFMGHYGDIEENASLVLQELEAGSCQAMEKADGDRLIDLLLILSNGVSAMSQLCPGLVETSANIGVVITDADKKLVSVQYMPRSSREESIKEYYATAGAIGRVAGFEVKYGTMFPSWAERKNSKLAEIMGQVFQEQNQQPMRVATIHAGLECSWHLQHNPAMDVVSIGTNNNDIHSPKETLELHTVPPQVLLIAETLVRI